MTIINLIEEVLNTKGIEVYKNPSTSEYMDLKKDMKKDSMGRYEVNMEHVIRFIHDEKDLYIWSAYDGTHYIIRKRLGLSIVAIHGLIKSNYYTYQNEFDNFNSIKEKLKNKMSGLGLRFYRK